MTIGNAAPGAGLVVVILLLAALYLLPTIVAVHRHHHQSGAVAAINFFLGWTLIGWVVSLAMGLSAHRAPAVVMNQFGSGQPLPPAGWYPDPSDSGRQRYWTGTDWGPTAA